MNSRTIILLACLALMTTGCTSTHPMRTVGTSGFLTHYEQIQKHPDWKANRVYISSTSNFSKYDRILLNPIIVMAVPNSDLGKIPDEKLQTLIDYFDAKLRSEISEVYPLTLHAGPTTAHIRIAITDGNASAPLRDLMSNVLPYGIAFSSMKRTIVGTHTAVGSAQAEIEVLDSITGDRIAAAIDARAGRKRLSRKFEKWADFQQVCDDWSIHIREGLKTSHSNQK